MDVNDSVVLAYNSFVIISVLDMMAIWFNKVILQMIYIAGMLFVLGDKVQHLGLNQG